MFRNFFNIFDIMNNIGISMNTSSKLIKQPNILKWYFLSNLFRLHELSFTEIKSIIEIKNPKSKIIIDKLIRN
jgi:hypothetical protein